MVRARAQQRREPNDRGMNEGSDCTEGEQLDSGGGRALFEQVVAAATTVHRGWGAPNSQSRSLPTTSVSIWRPWPRVGPSQHKTTGSSAMTRWGLGIAKYVSRTALLGSPPYLCHSDSARPLAGLSKDAHCSRTGPRKTLRPYGVSAVPYWACPQRS